MEKLKDGKIQLDGKTERQKDKLTVRRRDRQTDRQTDKRTVDGQTDEGTDKQAC